MTDSEFLIRLAKDISLQPYKIRLRKIARFIAEVEQFDVEGGDLVGWGHLMYSIDRFLRAFPAPSIHSTGPRSLEST